MVKRFIYSYIFFTPSTCRGNHRQDLFLEQPGGFLLLVALRSHRILEHCSMSGMALGLHTVTLSRQ